MRELHIILCEVFAKSSGLFNAMVGQGGVSDASIETSDIVDSFAMANLQRVR